jgi:hypothetical protein|tara:strand:- start:421 stop:663 length:243 start_codon:yes stop_codon:yes gene_type:complete
MPSKKKNPYIISRTDLDQKQGAISFTKKEVLAKDLGNGDFKFASLTKAQIAPSDPTQDEGRLYVKDIDGAVYYITATKVG